METTVGVDQDWAPIADRLPHDWRELAAKHGILTNQSAGSSGSGWKIQDLSVLLRMLLHYVCTNASLKTTVAVAAAMGLADISHVALQKWTLKCGDWMAAMVCAMVGSSASFSATRWAGYEVISADATTVQRPGATGTTARIHFAMRLVDLLAVAIRVTDEKVGETFRNFTMKAGQLWLADRGYSNANSIAHAVASKAAVLIRFAFGPLPLFDRSGTAFDYRAWVRRIKRPGAVRERGVWVHPKGHETLDVIEGRLIVFRLPRDKAEKARKRLYEEHKKSDVSAEMLEMAAYVVLFTTVPNERLGANELIELYRLRWQIELNFKREKSIEGLDKLPSHRPEAIHCWICTKLLGIELARRLAEPAEPFPPGSSANSRSGSAPGTSPPAQTGIVREIWRCAVLLWHTFRAALISVRTAHLQDVVKRFIVHLARSKVARQRSVDRFLQIIGAECG